MQYVNFGPCFCFYEKKCYKKMVLFVPGFRHKRKRERENSIKELVLLFLGAIIVIQAYRECPYF